jgi:multicomponent Na+:H+ antiporter subunit C
VIMEEVLSKFLIYWLIIILFLVGPFGMIFSKNLMKKLMAMNVMQVAVIIFFLALGQKAGATIPIETSGIADIGKYINPLPHALMLTAIVVSLATTGVTLSLLTLIQRNFGTLEEDEIMRRMEK